jgi:hypothetical protein
MQAANNALDEQAFQMEPPISKLFLWREGCVLKAEWRVFRQQTE